MPPVAPEAARHFRARFPIFRDKVHLASNSMGAVSDAILAAQAVCMSERLTLGTTWKQAMPRHEALRADFARMIGAKPSEIALCYSASQALGMVMSAMDWQKRPAIVFDEYSFPSTTYLWHAQAAAGAMPRMVRADAQGLISPDDFAPMLDESVGLVAVSHVCYKNGHRIDLAGLASRVHAVGGLLAVDDYQCAGTRPMDVKAEGIDILVTGAAKYLLASPGVGFLYVREGLFDSLHPRLTGWFGQEDMNAFTIGSHDEASDARRFQTGTPSLLAIYEAQASLALLAEAGMERIGEWVRQLTGHVMDRLAAEGIACATPREDARRGPQVTIRARDGGAAVAHLAARGIICSSRNGDIRTAWHYYNSLEDAERLIGALVERRDLLIAV